MPKDPRVMELLLRRVSSAKDDPVKLQWAEAMLELYSQSRGDDTPEKVAAYLRDADIEEPPAE